LGSVVFGFESDEGVEVEVAVEIGLAGAVLTLGAGVMVWRCGLGWGWGDVPPSETLDWRGAVVLERTGGKAEVEFAGNWVGKTCREVPVVPCGMPADCGRAGCICRVEELVLFCGFRLFVPKGEGFTAGRLVSVRGSCV
jgi:hypothetical protein